MNASESPFEMSKGLDDVETKVQYRFGISKRITCLCSYGIRHIGGMILQQAFAWNVRTCRHDVNGKYQAGVPVR